MIVVVPLCIWAAVIAWYDIRYRRVPNAALILVLVPAILALAIQGKGLLGEMPLGSIVGAVLGFALTLPGYVMRRFGAGDVKFAAVLGLLMGMVRGFELVLGASLLMGATAVLLLALKRSAQSKFPAAPMLAVAFVVEMLCGPLLLGAGM